jgi:hypothetical protein
MATQIQHLDIGDVWQPTWTFKVGTTNTDPSALVAKKMDPAGLVTTYNESNPAAPALPIVRTGAGVFRLDVPIDAVGYWYAKMTGTGAVVAAEAHEAVADPDMFTSNGGVSARALVGFGETKDWLNQKIAGATAEDLEIVRAINDISDRFHYEAGREFKVDGTNPQTRLFDVDQEAIKTGRVRVGDLAAAPTTVTILDTDWATVLETVATSDYLVQPSVRPSWAPIRALQFAPEVTTLRPGMRVSVAGTWGFPSVPGNVRQAVLDAIAENLDRDVEHARQDLAPITAGEAQNVIVIGRTGPTVVSMPPRALAVAWSYRDPLVG